MMPITLTNLNGGCGFSGTDAAMLEIAGGLALRGHGVRILSGGPANMRVGADGIRYLSPVRSFLDSDAVKSDLNEVDVFVISYLHDIQELFDILLRVVNGNKKSIRLVLHCQCIFSAGSVEAVSSACTQLGVHMYIAGVSDFVEFHTASCGRPYFSLGNGINPAIFCADTGVTSSREPMSFVFAASYERGGRIAREVHERLKTRGLHMGAMNVASYCDVTLPSLSKMDVAKLLDASDFFVYPLVLDAGNVHHDTFACSVLEALACGVEVVTWDVACMRNVYGEYITLVSPPPHPGYSPHAASGFNPEMLTMQSVDALADAVTRVAELPPQERERRRHTARTWALGQTWEKRVIDLESAMS